MPATSTVAILNAPPIPYANSIFESNVVLNSGFYAFGNIITIITVPESNITFYSTLVRAACAKAVNTWKNS